MDKILILLMFLYTCNGLIRKLPEGEPTETGGTKIELRMPGIVPQKVLGILEITLIYFIKII